MTSSAIRSWPISPNNRLPPCYLSPRERRPWKGNKIETLPRVLADFAKVESPRPRPKLFTVAQLNALYKAASPMMRLYLLLGLNCGFTQIDIATLTADMIDWDTGLLDRNRHKTGVQQGAKLWHVTLDALRERGKPGDTALLFISEQGRPLVWNGVKDDGTPTRADAVQRAFHRSKQKVEIPRGLSFKSLRKTGANMLVEKYTKEISDLYLAHSLGISGHYIKMQFRKLHKATDWLRTQFAFGPVVE